MSSLWTPEGEHRVPRQDDPTQVSEAAPARPPGPRPEEPVPGGAPSEEDLRRLTAELAAAPAEDVVANHCYGLFELAALHLSVRPPQLDKARLAIDSLGLLVDGLGDRLGQYLSELSEGLNQLRMAFVRVSSAAEADDGGRPTAADS